jgi:ribosomal protein S18 acetylase RimI-like enzyme
MAGFPLERRTLLVYLRGAVPAFPHGTYLVGRLRAPRAGTIEGRSEDAASTLDAASLASPRSSWSEEKSSAHGPVVATVGVSFTEATRRKFSSLAPPSDAAYLSDLTVFETERGNGLGIAMLAAAERFAVDMRAPSMYLHVATKKPGVVKLYKSQGYAIRAVDPGIFGWRGRLLMRKPMA